MWAWGRRHVGADKEALRPCPTGNRSPRLAAAAKPGGTQTQTSRSGMPNAKVTPCKTCQPIAPSVRDCIQQQRNEQVEASVSVLRRGKCCEEALDGHADDRCYRRLMRTITGTSGHAARGALIESSVVDDSKAFRLSDLELPSANSQRLPIGAPRSRLPVCALRIPAGSAAHARTEAMGHSSRDNE